MPNAQHKKEYKAWKSMKYRCYNPNYKHYSNYGGRGIKVCDKWRNDFYAFIADIGPSPTPKHSLDRIDVNRDYEPNNCRWATTKEQQNNKRNNRLITHNGETLTVSQWADRIGVNSNTLYQRLYLAKMSLAEVVTRNPLIEYDGKRLSATAWSKICNLSQTTISRRIRDGWTVEEALTTQSPSREIEFDGKKMTATEWAKLYSITEKNISSRIAAGWTPEEAITTPVQKKKPNSKKVGKPNE